jgi:hypothetical protein
MVAMQSRLMLLDFWITTHRASRAIAMTAHE